MFVNRHALRHRAAGFSMVESLVALLVLSIGLLGIAGLFVESVRNSRTALLRTQAVNLVGDMADRIRANADARDAYDVDAYGGAPEERGCAPTPDDDGDKCSSATLAEDDLARWITAVRAALPAFEDGPAQAEVQFLGPAAAGAPDRYQITVSWREPGEDLPLSYRSDVLIVPRAPLS
jgi:type IV pilus assembly protein PilV